ncbi:hypothetical protein [Cupriavidus metallidurans]|uniref:hypothetical protein n=1 Tax=Cupriavidus metallidurans TaxID=119219 RepID=UPI0035C6B318
MTDNRPLDDAGMPLLAEALPRSLRNLIADDGYACTFQTMGQYRTALLKAFDAAVATHRTEMGKLRHVARACVTVNDTLAESGHFPFGCPERLFLTRTSDLLHELADKAGA